MWSEYEKEVWVWKWGLSNRSEYEYEGWPISSDWDNLAALTVFPMQAGPLPQRSGWKVSSFTKTQWQRQRQFYSMSPLSRGSTQLLIISVFVKHFPGKGNWGVSILRYGSVRLSEGNQWCYRVSVRLWACDCVLCNCVSLWEEGEPILLFSNLPWVESTGNPIATWVDGGEAGNKSI